MLFEFTEVNTQKNFRNNKINVTNDFIRGILCAFPELSCFFFGRFFCIRPQFVVFPGKTQAAHKFFQPMKA